MKINVNNIHFSRTALEATYVLCHFLQPIMPDKMNSFFQWINHPFLTLPQLKSFKNLIPGTKVKYVL
jgi:hypothetical protein